ncbi:hypothetical protein DFP72DRAFT_1065040 [Ephemerocybe angulata]|uniref:Uncharacterized protein n=1 Tax=Ephemerocybe angulata TaxID=980116 RepID=A0A8H6I5P0_9AGAR|nr:hypothetical protein DFP72DRAFT_1065040 [Tulosesus angulatus]
MYPWGFPKVERVETGDITLTPRAEFLVTPRYPILTAEQLGPFGRRPGRKRASERWPGWYPPAKTKGLDAHKEAPPQPKGPRKPQLKALPDFSALTPGWVHQLNADATPSPQSIIDGTFEQANAQRDMVIYVLRRPEHSGPPSIEPILLAVNGKPGPYIKDIVKRNVVLDGADDKILEERVWRQTWWMIDWPGCSTKREAISLYAENGDPITRAQFIEAICASLCDFFVAGRKGMVKKQWGVQFIDDVSRDWKLKHVDYRDVRIIAVNYYKNTWVPVLAMDTEAEVEIQV